MADLAAPEFCRSKRVPPRTAKAHGGKMCAPVKHILTRLYHIEPHSALGTSALRGKVVMHANLYASLDAFILCTAHTPPRIWVGGP